MSKSGGTYIENEIMDSKAFRDLPGTSFKVLFMFMSKRRMEKTEVGKRKGWIIKNNGEIRFTYREAELRGIPRPTFRLALKNLIECGFIDITHLGNGFTRGDVTLYSLSERWRKYGTEDFIEPVRRRKDTRCQKNIG